jgi:hypothetical protein
MNWKNPAGGAADPAGPFLAKLAQDNFDALDVTADITVLVVESISDPSDANMPTRSGWAPFVSATGKGRSAIVVRNAITDDTNTTAHEIGHTFGLTKHLVAFGAAPVGEVLRYRLQLMQPVVALGSRIENDALQLDGGGTLNQYTTSRTEAARQDALRP